MADDRLLPTSQSADLPTFQIFAGGQELPSTANAIAVMVTLATNRIPTARLIFKDGDAAKEDFPLSNSAVLIPGQEIAILAGYHNDNNPIFKGIVVKQTLQVKSNHTTYLVVECKDRCYPLSLGRKSKYFPDATDSDAIEEILQAYGLEKTVEASSVKHRRLVQYDASDWDFLVSRSEANGQIVLVDSGKVTITKPDLSSTPTVKLTYGANILSLDAVLDATYQPNSITCLAWNPAEQAVVEAEAASPQVREAGNLAAADLAGKVAASSVRYTHTGHLSSDALQAWADAQKLRQVLSKIRGVARCKGLPQLKPGQVIELAGVGDRFTGNVFVSGVHHELSEGAWGMDVQFGLAPEQFTETFDVTDRPAAGLLPAVHGLQIGVVSQLEGDPDGEHRILVTMPAVDPTAPGLWARVASLDAGKDRGAFFLPEVGDEVVLGFLNSDPSEAIVLGMLNSSKNPAPETAADANPIKGFYTREKLKLVFNDEKKIIRLETPKGYVLQLSEDEGAILIQDENQNKIQLNQDGIALESGKDITVKDANNNMVKLSADGIALESGKDITIKATGGVTIQATSDLKLEGMNIQLSANANFKASGNAGVDLSSSAITTIKGSLVNIN